MAKATRGSYAFWPSSYAHDSVQIPILNGSNLKVSRRLAVVCPPPERHMFSIGSWQVSHDVLSRTHTQHFKAATKNVNAHQWADIGLLLTD
jgi:hypothetical protein